MIKEKLEKNIVSALKKLGVVGKEINLEHPANPDFGDFATSIALKLTKTLKRKPLQIAEDISNNLSRDDLIEKVEIVKPGFINFWISKKYLLTDLEKIEKQKDLYGKNQSIKSKRIVVEFTDPNPFKEFHIGHLYSNIVGESLCRIWEVNGAIVKRVNYQGDVGMHVAKSLWGMRKKIKEENITLRNLSKKKLKEKVKFLGQSYALGAASFEEDKKYQEEIKDINYYVFITAQEYLQETVNWIPQVDYKKYVKLDNTLYQEIKELYRSGRDWSLQYFDKIYERLGTKFEFYYFESVVGEFGAKIVYEFLKKKIFEKSEGAIIFPGKKYGLHDRVFINSLGLPTYEAKELGLAPTKYKEWKYDTSYIVTGKEINEYFKVLIKALTLVSPELGNKTNHIGHGMVKLPEGKMSSRSGKILTGEWLLDEAKNAAEQLLNKNILDATEIDKLSENIGIAAIKYALLKSSIGKDIEFSLSESINFEGNSGPYLLYTYVRTQSVLKKIQFTNASIKHLIEANTSKEEKDLLRALNIYPETVFEAAKNLAPNLIANYLYDLAQKYNLFYQKHKILDAEENAKNLRLLLTQSTGQVLKNGLYLLGIKTVDRM